ncbi:MAG: response regulator [Terriglobia bacterium]
MVNSESIEKEMTVSRIVLVADDNMTIQRMAAEMLAEQGLEVVTVANGVAAIKKLAILKPAMVLADVDMPGRDGYEVCDFVKKSAELCDVPVILAFSDADPFDQERVTAVRADGVVKKPFNGPELLARVEEFIGKTVTDQQPSSESGLAAGADDPKSPEQAHAPAEFTFADKPAPAASFAGIPEGAGLFEPELAPTETLAAVLSEQGPAIPAPGAEESPSTFTVNASAEIAGPCGELAESSATAAIGAQEAALELSPIEMQALPQTPAAESAPEITSREINAENPMGAGVLSSPAEDAASRLGDWKLGEIPPSGHRDAGMNGPILAALPDLTAALHFPVPAEEIERETVSTPQDPEVDHTPTWVGAEVQDTKSAVEAAAEKLEASLQPEPAVSSNLLVETPSGKTEEEEYWVDSPAAPDEPPSDFVPHAAAAPVGRDLASELPSDVAYGEVASAPAQEPPVEKTEEDRPRDLPASVSEVEAVEHAGAEGEIEPPSASASDAATSPAAEEEQAGSFTASSGVSVRSTEEAAPVKPDSSPSWEAPSEAALNEAFLEASLSSTGLVHARVPWDAAEQWREPPAALDDVQNPFEAHRAPAPAEPQKTEPAGLEAAPPLTIDRTLVELIVQRVVVRMSPSVLSPEMIEHLVEKLTGECLEELQPDRL